MEKLPVLGDVWRALYLFAGPYVYQLQGTVFVVVFVTLVLVGLAASMDKLGDGIVVVSFLVCIVFWLYLDYTTSQGLPMIVSP